MPTTKAVLIFGGSGFVGSSLALALRERFKVFATYHTRPLKIPGVTFLPSQLNNRDWVKRVIYAVSPDAIIYAAGSNSLEYAEKEPNLAEQLHSGGPANIVNIAHIFPLKFIYLSNCYAFDGVKGNYRETESGLPSAALGKSKVSGENYVRSKSMNYVILRSSPIFGLGNGYNLSFFDTLRLNLGRGQRMDCGIHDYHSYVYIDSLIEAVSKLVDSGVRNKLFHLGGLTTMNQLELGRAFAARFGFDSGLLIPKKSVQYQSGTANIEEPDNDYSLNSTRLVEALKIKPLLIEECFDLIEKQLIARS